ncbi:MAG TPA: phosphatidylserine decarboxylase [Methylomirabilota bacterium]|nr:phosphatidylserine decarboxylase [Methylomirabilota bacterium]
MKHSGKAMQAGMRLIFWSLIALVVLFLIGLLATLVGHLIAFVSLVLISLWILFSLFTLFFFRDPTPRVPEDSDAIAAPAHGKVDAIDELDEPEFMGGRCRRISIFLSVFDVHVQNAPVAGRIAHVKQNPGQFLNAMRLDSAAFNENTLVGIESAEAPSERVAVRLIAGLIARRIVLFATLGETLTRGERLALIQFGSRVDLYLPMETEVTVRLGQRVRGGQTIVARRKMPA